MPRTLLPVIALALLAFPALVGAADPAALAQCAAIEAPDERLACYDRLAGREASAAPAAAPVPTVYRERDMSTAVTRHWDLDRRDGLLRLRPHYPNYFLPVRATDRPNDAPSTPTQPPPQPTELSDVEAKFQVSVKAKVLERILGGPDLWLAYTQQSNWQVYNGSLSRPFRETDYQPEAILTWPLEFTVLGLKARYFNVGLNHQSNGRADPLSRSWNRLYAAIGFERGDFALQLRPWWRIPERAEKDDNPDIDHFMGPGDLVAVYRRGGHQFILTGRYNFRFDGNGKGAAQLEWMFPIYERLKGYVQVFSGYGESLIDYNWRQTTVGVGVSIADWL